MVLVHMEEDMTLGNVHFCNCCVLKTINLKGSSAVFPLSLRGFQNVFSVDDSILLWSESTSSFVYVRELTEKPIC